jgi:nucleotide-binding universal stress UspA family protein
MPIGKILVPLMGLPVDRPALELAFRAGQHLDAHVAGMYAAYDALSVVAEAAEAPNDAMSVESRTRAREARANFDAAKAKSGAAPRNRPAQGVGFSTAFVLANGRLDDMVAEHGRTADVTVITLPAGQEGTLRTTVLHAAIMETSKPVLLTPVEVHADPFRRIAVAWNGSASAAQALGHALPFLAKAEQVTVFDLKDPVFGGPPAAQAAEYIGWHGITAQVVPLQVGPGKLLGPALVEATEAAGSGLLVMGAYSQSRVRRIIAGGVTRTVMERTRLPVLMAH